MTSFIFLYDMYVKVIRQQTKKKNFNLHASPPRFCLLTVISSLYVLCYANLYILYMRYIYVCEFIYLENSDGKFTYELFARMFFKINIYNFLEWQWKWIFSDTKLFLGMELGLMLWHSHDKKVWWSKILQKIFELFLLKIKF